MVYENVGQLLQGRVLRSITEDNTAYDACLMLDEFHIGALAVMRTTTLVGILSERDIIRRVVVKGRHFIETKVADVMTPDPCTIQASDGLAEALDKMIQGHFRHLPVVEGREVIGMISIRDVPLGYWHMKQRYEAITTTPVAVTEAAVDQHTRDRPPETPILPISPVLGSAP